MPRSSARSLCGCACARRGPAGPGCGDPRADDRRAERQHPPVRRYRPRPGRHGRGGVREGSRRAAGPDLRRAADRRGLAGPAAAHARPCRRPGLASGRGGQRRPRRRVLQERATDLKARVAPATGQPFSAARFPSAPAVQKYDFDMNARRRRLLRDVPLAGANILATAARRAPPRPPVGGGAARQDSGQRRRRRTATRRSPSTPRATPSRHGMSTTAATRTSTRAASAESRRAPSRSATVPTPRRRGPRDRRPERRRGERQRGQRVGRLPRAVRRIGYVTDRNRPLVRRLAGNAFGPAAPARPRPDSSGGP